MIQSVQATVQRLKMISKVFMRLQQIQKGKMKICNATPMLILLFTGYLCTSMDVAAQTTPLSNTDSLPPLKVTEDPGLEEPPKESDPVPEERLSTTLVAGISISLVLLLILVITGVWYARNKSKAEMNSIPSGEPGVSLQKISTYENQQEWPFERALQ